MNSINFEILAKKLMEEGMYVVLSKRSDGRYSLAYQLMTQTSHGERGLFMKNSLILETPTSLIALLDCIITSLRVISKDELTEEQRTKIEELGKLCEEL